MKVLFITIGILAAGITGCSSGPGAGKPDSSAEFADAEMAVAEAPPPRDKNEREASPATVPAPERKLIKDGELEIQVKDYHAERDSVQALLKRYNGYIASESESRRSYRISNTFELRIPREHFDALMEDLAGRAEQVAHRRVTVQDVTDRYYDLELRIKNKKELEKRYLEILSKAQSVKDILEIEATLNDVRTDIERMEGSRRLLDNQISYSTLRLTVFQITEYRYEPAPKPSFFQRIGVALQSGWGGFLNLVVGLFYLWPLFILAVIVTGLIIWWRRKKRNAS